MEEAGGDVEAAAESLHKQLTPTDKWSAWSKHQAWLKNQGTDQNE